MKRIFLALLLAISPFLSFAQQKLSAEEKKLVERIDKNYQETVALLEEVVNINSGSLNLEGVREVGRIFEREFQKIGFQTEWVDVPAEV
jgi:glutamate carboxypeptidase